MFCSFQPISPTYFFLLSVAFWAILCYAISSDKKIPLPISPPERQQFWVHLTTCVTYTYHIMYKKQFYMHICTITRQKSTRFQNDAKISSVPPCAHPTMTTALHHHEYLKLIIFPLSGTFQGLKEFVSSEVIYLGTIHV